MDSADAVDNLFTSIPNTKMRKDAGAMRTLRDLIIYRAFFFLLLFFLKNKDLRNSNFCCDWDHTIGLRLTRYSFEHLCRDQVVVLALHQYEILYTTSKIELNISHLNLPRVKYNG